MSAAFRVTEHKAANGWREIGIYAEAALVAVITRPCAGADWFLHTVKPWGKERFKSRKAAMDRATKLAQDF